MAFPICPVVMPNKAEEVGNRGLKKHELQKKKGRACLMFWVLRWGFFLSLLASPGWPCLVGSSLAVCLLSVGVFFVCLSGGIWNC